MDPNKQPQAPGTTQTGVPPIPQPLSGTVPPANPTAMQPPVQQTPVAAPIATPAPASPPAAMPQMATPTMPAMQQSIPQEGDAPAAPLPPGSPPLMPTAMVTPQKKKGGFLKVFIILIILLIILGGGGAGAYFYFMGKNNTETNTIDEVPATEDTTDTSQETSNNDDTSAPVLFEIPEEDIDTNPGTITHTNPTYGFSIDYLTSWDFECTNCDKAPENPEQTWPILEMKTFDFETDEEDKIVRGARLQVIARSPDEGAEKMDQLIASNTGFAKSTYNGIDGILNLDPSASTQGFIYTNEDVGLDIELKWKSTKGSDRADQELQTILKSFKKI